MLKDKIISLGQALPEGCEALLDDDLPCFVLSTQVCEALFEYVTPDDGEILAPIPNSSCFFEYEKRHNSDHQGLLLQVSDNENVVIVSPVGVDDVDQIVISLPSFALDVDKRVIYPNPDVGFGDIFEEFQRIGANIIDLLHMLANVPLQERHSDLVKLNAIRQKKGRPALSDYSTLYLTGSKLEGRRGGGGGAPRRKHFVRAFRRVRRGCVEHVRAHWRGDEELGVIKPNRRLVI